MRSVITGGAGFLGSHLAEKLVTLKHDVIVLDNFFVGKLYNLKNIRDKIKIIKCDISKKGSWGQYLKKADYVFHLAALADIVPSIENSQTWASIVGVDCLGRHCHQRAGRNTCDDAKGDA